MRASSDHLSDIDDDGGDNMVDALRTWLLGIVLISFASGVARQLVAGGKEQAVVRLVSGLLMVLALLQPLASMPWKEESLAVGSFYESSRRQAQEYKQTQQKNLAGIIAEKTSSYIWDKATELGLECTVSVDVTVTESGIPLPDAVYLTATYSEALAVWLEEVVGIPAEKQIWQEGSA